jgi:hypothetical protein
VGRAPVGLDTSQYLATLTTQLAWARVPVPGPMCTRYCSAVGCVRVCVRTQPFGWPAREFLRKLVVGKPVRFVVEYKKETGAGARDFAAVYLADPSAPGGFSENVYGALCQLHRAAFPVPPRHAVISSSVSAPARALLGAFPHRVASRTRGAVGCGAVGCHS